MTQKIFQTPQEILSEESWRLALRQKTEKEKFKELQHKILQEIFD